MVAPLTLGDAMPIYMLSCASISPVSASRAITPVTLGRGAQRFRVGLSYFDIRSDYTVRIVFFRGIF